MSALSRIVVFICVLAFLWLPLALPIYWQLADNSNLASIITMAILFVELLVLWQLWGKLIHQENNIIKSYGLVISSPNFREFCQGLAFGFWLCLSLFITEAVCGWIKVVPSEGNLLRIALEGWLSALGIALAEELLFRGWLLDELERDYGYKTCIWATAIAFAVAHFLKPLSEIIRTAVTFPALVLLGLALVGAKYKHGDRLGFSIGIHGGLVWCYYIVNVGQLIEYSQGIPPWITGIDGNPLAGIMGLLFLSGLVWLIFTNKFSNRIKNNL